MGLGFKSSTGDFFGGHHHTSAAAVMNSAAEPLYASVKTDDSADAIASSYGKQSTAIYNEPFGCTAEAEADYSGVRAAPAVYALPSKNLRRPVTPQSTDEDLYSTADLLVPYPALALIPADRICTVQQLGSGSFGRADLARLIIDDQSVISVLIRRFPAHCTR